MVKGASLPVPFPFFIFCLLQNCTDQFKTDLLKTTYIVQYMRTAYFAFESMEQKGRKSNVYKNDKCTHIKNQKSRAGLCTFVEIDITMSFSKAF